MCVVYAHMHIINNYFCNVGMDTVLHLRQFKNVPCLGDNENDNVVFILKQNCIRVLF